MSWYYLLNKNFWLSNLVLNIASMKENSHVGSGLKQEEAGAPEQTLHNTNSSWQSRVKLAQL